MDLDYRAPRGFGGQYEQEARNLGELLRITIAIGGLVLGGTVLASPLLQDAAERYSENRPYGIDRMLTGSIDQPGRTYTIRRSVLSAEVQRVPHRP